MSLHKSYVTQANYDALPVPISLKKRNLPTNMPQLKSGRILTIIRKNSLKHLTLPRFEPPSGLLAPGLFPYLYATEPCYLEAKVIFVM